MNCELPDCTNPAELVLTLSDDGELAVCHEDLDKVDLDFVNDARAVDPTDEHARNVAEEFLTFGVVEGR